MKVEPELNGSVFSWSLVISSLLSPGLIFWSSFLLKTLWLLTAFFFFKQLITGSNLLYFCGPLKIFLLARLTLE